MSKRLEATITCPNCRKQFEYTLYRSIWGEYPANRELVMSNKINVATCDICTTETKLVFPFMYTNAKQCFAVWWEPVYDPQIDTDTDGYISMLGKDNYLATAPRIKDWEEFKNTIIKFENGELETKPPEMSPKLNNLMEGVIKDLEKNSKKKSGCLGAIMAFVFIIPSVTYSLFQILT